MAEPLRDDMHGDTGLEQERRAGMPHPLGGYLPDASGVDQSREPVPTEEPARFPQPCSGSGQMFRFAIFSAACVRLSAPRGLGRLPKPDSCVRFAERSAMRHNWPSVILESSIH
jgi:hypothetical protein